MGITIRKTPAPELATQQIKKKCYHFKSQDSSTINFIQTNKMRNYLLLISLILVVGIASALPQSLESFLRHKASHLNSRRPQTSGSSSTQSADNERVCITKYRRICNPRATQCKQQPFK